MLLDVFSGCFGVCVLLRTLVVESKSLKNMVFVTKCVSKEVSASWVGGIS